MLNLNSFEKVLQKKSKNVSACMCLCVCACLCVCVCWCQYVYQLGLYQRAVSVLIWDKAGMERSTPR